MNLASHLLQRIARLPNPVTRDVTVQRDLRIPLSDGTVLLADHWVPAGDRPLPTALARTPYGRGAAFSALLGRAWAERGFQALVVSTRGTFGSAGEFRPMHHERADGLEVLDWLAGQPWYDGRVVLHGPSYLGYTQWAVAADAPQVTAMVPHVTSARLVATFVRPGAYALDTLLRWSVLTAWQERRTGRLTVRLAERAVLKAMHTLPLADADLRVLGQRWAFYQDTLAHEMDDPHWADSDHSGRVAEVRIPASFVAGWYDLFIEDQLRDYQVLRDAGTEARLTVGPWHHSQPANLVHALREGLDWARAHTQGDPRANGAPVRLFVMGEGRWRDFDEWPPPGYRPVDYHLQPGGGLAVSRPPEAEPSRYRYDPANPTPHAGGPLLMVGAGRKNQAARESRPDVLTFSSEALRADVEVIGVPSATVWLRSTRPTTDLLVTLCDVDPRGRSFNVCDGIVRARPDGVTEVRMELTPTAHRFRRGHRIRVQVSSGAHPRYARNPGGDEPLATAATLHPADQQVFHEPEHPSVITLPVG